MATWFISDLHLSPERPKTSLFFEKTLEKYADEMSALYVLGDLFERWVGDDQIEDYERHIAKCFRKLAEKNVPIYFMAGNRDFLLGKRFLKIAKMKKLKDPSVVLVANRKIFLTHGDRFLTDDLNYQRFRFLVQNKISQRLFLLLPLWLRKKIGQKIRDNSKGKYQDLNQKAVQKTCRKYKTPLFIHGHTHKPARHPFHYKSHTYERFVLGEWLDHHADIGILSDKGEFSLCHLKEDLSTF